MGDMVEFAANGSTARGYVAAAAGGRDRLPPPPPVPHPP